MGEAGRREGRSCPCPRPAAAGAAAKVSRSAAPRARPFDTGRREGGRRCLHSAAARADLIKRKEAEPARPRGRADSSPNRREAAAVTEQFAAARREEARLPPAGHGGACTRLGTRRRARARGTPLVPPAERGRPACETQGLGGLGPHLLLLARSPGPEDNHEDVFAPAGALLTWPPSCLGCQESES